MVRSWSNFFLIAVCPLFPFISHETRRTACLNPVSLFEAYLGTLGGDTDFLVP